VAICWNIKNEQLDLFYVEIELLIAIIYIYIFIYN